MIYISEIKLAFGLDMNGKVVHINELTENERGKACGCVCPSCGKELQARLGQKNRHHFSHDSENCSAETATETAIHLLAKEIIIQEGAIVFPAISLKFKDSTCYSYKYVNKVPEKIKQWPEQLVKCEKVLLEQSLTSIVPDIIFISEKDSTIIEIAVTHFIDEEKRDKIKSLGINSIEIDLSKYHNQEFDRESFYKDIVENTDNRNWIFHIDFDRIINEAELEYQNRINLIDEEEKRIREEQKERDRLESERKKAYYIQKLKEYRSDDLVKYYTKNLRFYKDNNKDINSLFFMDIPIDGEIIFKCDRRIWQSAIFDKFIYYRTATDISKEKINKWAVEYQKIFEKDWKLIGKLANTYDVIEKYLSYMNYLGFISKLYRGKAEVLCSHSLVPPNNEHAEVLRKAINSIDKENIYPNSDIRAYLNKFHDEKAKVDYFPKIITYEDESNRDVHLKPFVMAQRRIVKNTSKTQFYCRDKTKKNSQEYYHQSQDDYRLKNNSNTPVNEQESKMNAFCASIDQHDFSKEIVIDPRGFHWLQCVVCGKKQMKMNFVSGTYGNNSLALCKECDKKTGK